MNKTAEEIHAIAGEARYASPAKDDDAFACIRKGDVARPVLVRSSDDAPAFWLVPYVSGKSACGYARIELSGTVSQVAVFGTGDRDPRSWIDVSFFEHCPEPLLAEIARQYPNLTVSRTLMSYDRTPAKWAWRVELSDGVKVQEVAFISPGGWYARQAESENSTRDG